MEAVTTTLQAIRTALDFVLLHWQFSSVAAIMACLGEASDRTFTALVKQRWIPLALWRLGRASLPAHPVLVGLLAAYLKLPPESGIVPGSAAAYAYWGSPGVVSLVFWGVLRSLGKKAGIDMTLPGEEEIPSRPPPPMPPAEGTPDESKHYRVAHVGLRTILIGLALSLLIYGTALR